MNLPEKYLFSDLLKHRVRCDQGLDHGPGIIAWMHPPVHRLLGWVSRPSTLRVSRDVWRLNQIKGIGSDEIYVKGLPSSTEQNIIDRLPSLMFSSLLGINGQKLGLIADFIFEVKTGKIINYLVSRTDPRIPGTSRWRLLIQDITYQQPGMVETEITSLDQLPLVRSSIKNDFFKKSRHWREQIQDFSDHATNKLEGWLDENPWENRFNNSNRYTNSGNSYTTDEWLDELKNTVDDSLEFKNDLSYPDSKPHSSKPKDDPWI